MDEAQHFFQQARAHINAQDFVSAIAALDNAIKLNPNFVQAYNDRASLYYQLQHYQQAFADCDMMLKLAPHYAKAYVNRGLLYKKQGEFSKAKADYDKAISLDAELAEAYGKRANLLAEQGQYQQALLDHDKAIALAPELADYYVNRANAYGQLHRYDAALADQDKALQLAPGHLQARFNRSLLLMLLGRFAEGFAEHEVRFKVRPYHYERLMHSHQRWQGEALQAKTIILIAEQGDGDTLQFVRFAKGLKAQGARVVLFCKTGLLRLLSQQSYLDDVLDLTMLDKYHEFDYYLPLLSMPMHMPLVLDELAKDVPYISVADNVMQPQASALLQQAASPKVGIVWQGDPKHGNDAKRSVDVKYFVEVQARLGFTLYHLQLNAGDAGKSFIDLSKDIKDYADTAVILQQLDVLITVDTSVVHLAGALGVNTYLLLPYCADWRWLLDREDSPWYPSVRLLRQSAHDDWAGVFAQLSFPE